MPNIKALVVGVSNYYISGFNDLSFCKNDVTAMVSALQNGFKMNNDEIITCGSLGEVRKQEFLYALLLLTSLTNENDVVIFYFSGHGETIQNQHYLVMSDELLSTQDIISYFEKISAKSKIIFLDCCFSGNYTVTGTSKLNIMDTVAEFQGKGYAVFSSSNSSQVSYGRRDKPLSVFTSFLCEAIQDKHIIKQGKITLYDIQKLVAMYLEVWSKNNPDEQQHPIFRANMGGTIFFDVEDYKPFYTTRIYSETDKYIIYNVEPSHTGLLKRYSVKVILKEPLSLDEMGKISLEIKDKVRTVEVYANEIAQRRLTGKPANLIWVYFGRDENDMIKCNFICHTTWVDDKQDKKLWYRVNKKNVFMVNGVHFNLHTYYEQLKIFNEDNTGNKDELVLKTKEILSHMLTLAERIIYHYNEYKNGIFSEAEMVDKIECIISEVEKYYFLSSDLGIAPDEIHDWDQACTELLGTIHDFSLFYNKKYLLQRNTENRKACMEMTIRRYYSDLEKVQKLEEKI